MAFSKRVRFGRRVPLGLVRLEFSSELTAGDKDRRVTFRWEPDRRRETEERDDRRSDEQP